MSEISHLTQAALDKCVAQIENDYHQIEPALIQRFVQQLSASCCPSPDSPSPTVENGSSSEARYLGRYLPLSDSDKTDDLDDSEEGLTRQLKKLISQRKAPNVQLNAIKELMERKYGKVTQKQADMIDKHTAERICDLADRLLKPRSSPSPTKS